MLEAFERKFGLKPPPGNRIQRAIEITERSNRDEIAIVDPRGEDEIRVLEAFRTLFETFVVVWTATERRRKVNPFPPDRLKYLFEGADTAAGDSNTTARNVQFELLVGAYLILGGADLRPEEPDYRFLYHGEYVGIAVKRLTSVNPNTLFGALRDAARQLQGSTGRGLIALNLDTWLQDLAAEDSEQVGARFQQQLHDAYRQLEKISAKDAVLGFFIRGTVLKWVLEGPKPMIDWRSPAQVIVFSETPADVERFKEYFQPLQRTLERSIEEFGRVIQVGSGAA